MVALILNIIMIFTFFFSGYVVQGVKKFISVSTSWILKLLSLFGIKLNAREESVYLSEEFRNTYKGIRVVKLSKKNIKQESSIDWVNLGILVTFGIIYLINLKAISGNIITNWMYSWVSLIPLLGSFVADELAMNTFFTAGVFSILTFSATKVVGRWKATKQQRIEHKQAIIKAKAIEAMSSKELLDAARDKDNSNEERLK